MNDIDYKQDLADRLSSISSIRAQKVFEYIYRLSANCPFRSNVGDRINFIPVVVNREDMSHELDMCTRTLIRAIDSLVKDKYIYSYKYNNSYIYSIIELNPNVDVIARIRLSH